MTNRGWQYKEIAELEKQLESLDGASDPQLHLFRDRINDLISDIAGKRSTLAIRFNGIQWKNGSWSPAGMALDSFGRQSPAFITAESAAREILKALKHQLDKEAANNLEHGFGSIIDSTVIDPALWDHVAGLCESGEWEKLPIQTSVFLENMLRTWTDVPPTTNSLEVFSKALEYFPLGDTPGEANGWNLIARGFALGIRNRSGHRLHDRDDIKRYAFGVLGSASLLLTEIKRRHGDPPQSF